MSGTEEVPGTRPTDTPKKETAYQQFIGFVKYFLPILMWIGIGLFILKVGDY